LSRNDQQRLADILAACNELDLVLERGKSAYDGDPLLRRAAERLLEIVGESANALSEDSKARFPAVPWREITGLRIVLAHHYHRVDPEQVWTIVIDEIPSLKNAISGAESA